ncbi:MAG: hypothetical protein M3O15_02440 [Acidobacteriota bacterium]|nr:hypothetical protein [Acidobacteriota bacterium]
MEDSTKKMVSLIPVVCLTLALAAVGIVYFNLRNTTSPLERLTVVVGYVIVILVFFFGLMVLIAMATDKINLSGLLCEPGTDSKASIGRFQLLIFTFVIAFSLFLIIISGSKDGKDLKFPEVPTGILTLLGISASTYAVGKGIQASQDTAPGPAPVVVAAPAPVVVPAPAPVVVAAPAPVVVPAQVPPVPGQDAG